MQRLQGWAERGNTLVAVQGLNSTTKVQGSFPGATITIYNAGTITLASIFSDNNASPTPKANPFTASADGSWFLYAANGRYDVVFSGTGIVTPFTLSDFELFDSAASSGSAAIGFIQTGTGAVANTAQAKMRERFTVTDFMTTAERADALAGTLLLDMTAAFNLTIAAAAARAVLTENHPEIIIPQGAYYTATGIVVTSIDGLTIRFEGGIVIVKSDVEPWKWDGCRDWEMYDPTFATTTNTTKAALRIANGSIGYNCYNFRCDTGAGKFKYGVLNDGAYIGNWYGPFTTEFSVSDIGMYFKDGSGIGTYPPAAIAIYGPNIGAGNTGMKFEDTTDALVSGGTVEDNSSTKNIWILNSTSVVVLGTHCEVPSNASSNVYIDTSKRCIVDSMQANGVMTFRNADSCQLRNIGPLANYDIDTASSDNLILGGIPNSNPPGGFLNELGTRTMVVGMQFQDGGNILALRTNGVNLFAFTTTGGMNWSADTDFFRTSAGALRTTGTLQADAGLITVGDLVLNGRVTTIASTTAGAKLRLPAGTAPTSPVNGDMWTTTAGLFVRINGATVGPLS